MDNPGDSRFRLKRTAANLPVESDFDPFGGCLDARSAWRHFGRLSLQQAYDLFISNPLRYQEDFMFMGPRAFEYYLPVIDRYLREVPGGEDLDGCEAAILGSGIGLQFDSNDSALSKAAVSEIEDLSAFVRAHLARFSPETGEQGRIEEAWRQVDVKIAQYRREGEPGH